MLYLYVIVIEILSQTTSNRNVLETLGLHWF